MSIINKDKADGARTQLKDVDASLRDQIVRKLFKKLKEMDIGAKVERLWLAGQANRQLWLERQKVYLDSIDNHTSNNASGPFEGSSQIHLPIPLIVVKTFHARMVQAIMGVDPPFHTKARNEASIERVPCVADTMRYYILDGANYGKGIEELMDRWLWDWIATGVGIKKWRWDCKYERFTDVQMVPRPGPAKISIVNGIEQATPTMKMVEEEVEVIKKCFEGPVCEIVSYEDVCIVGGEGDPDRADAVLHRQYLTASELWTLVDRKIFDRAAVEEIIESGPDKKTGGLGNEIKMQRADNAGHAAIDGEENLDRYEIIESYISMCVDNSGINSEVVVWVHPRTRELCRATYLRRISPAGDRPFAKIDFQPRKGQEFAAGLIEMIYPLSKEMDAIHNMRIDWGMISVMPFGFYRASSGLDPETIRFEPGSLIPVDNPQADVYFPQLGNRTVFGMQEEQALHTMVERLTSISDINLGVISGQGATRTATGSRLVNNEMSSNLDIYLKRGNRGWKKSLRYLLHMLQNRIPVGLSFRLTGDDGKDYWRTVKSAEDLAGDYDIEVSPNSESSNQQIQIDKAQQIMQTVMNPMLIQTGVVGPSEIYEAAKNFYQSLGVKDFRRYLAKQDPNAAYAKLTPEQEANLLLHGIEVPVLPNMDHEGFIAFFQLYHDTDELNGQYGPEQLIALAKQAKKHEQMMQAMQQMAAQQANSNQMQMNAAQSQQQAPVGLNPGAKPAPAPAPGQAPNG